MFPDIRRRHIEAMTNSQKLTWCARYPAITAGTISKPIVSILSQLTGLDETRPKRPQKPLLHFRAHAAELVIELWERELPEWCRQSITTLPSLDRGTGLPAVC